jgi:uncharacterized protein
MGPADGVQRMSRPVALITGASSGIGRSFAHLFARDGYDLVLVSRRAAPLQDLSHEIARSYATSARVVPADLAKAESPLFLYTQLQRIDITVDVLVNNAGVGMQGAFAALPLDRQLQMIQLNISSLTTLTRLLLPSMLERRTGGVLNVGSTAGFQPGPFMAVYYATKAYVVSFSEALSEEVAGSGVRVTCLAPGPTETGFAGEAGATGARLFRGEMMTADDVARIGYDGWKEGKPMVIAGAANRRKALLVRFAPRSLVLKAVRRLNSAAE